MSTRLGTITTDAQFLCAMEMAWKLAKHSIRYPNLKTKILSFASFLRETRKLRTQAIIWLKNAIYVNWNICEIMHFHYKKKKKKIKKY